ncbi:MAG TPA: phenylalanine 4-monooxygenase [Edaphocola sp.]|nr:phenylalanine 4-monooxygenase [Edaphocola sp.]
MNIRPVVQDYDNYTPGDLAVWQLLFDRQMALLQQYASNDYLQALGQIGFNAVTIPDFKETNARLGKLTGWQLIVAPGLVPPEKFFGLLAQKIFPATCWLRTMEQLDYLEEPDMFHDVFGHVPLLGNKAYAAFMESFGKLALKWREEPEALQILSRIYWFTIEFGLLEEQDKVKLFGAGILSSTGESCHALSDTPQKKEFNLEEVMTENYRTDVLQEKFYIIHSFEQLCATLPAIEKHIERHIATKVPIKAFL